MFIRVWHKVDNVGSDDTRNEEHIAIRSITRFYRRKYDLGGNRYIVSTGDDTYYVEEKTFEYLKSLRNRNIFEKGKVHYPRDDGR